MAQVFNATVQDEFGNAISGATVTVKVDDAGGALATLYSDEEGLVPLANPFTSEADGLAQFWADAGTYYIEATSGADTSDGWTVELGGVGGSVSITLTAAAAIGEAVTFDGALVTLATIDEVAGIATAAGGIGDTIFAINEGNITVGTWAWTPDEFVYLDAAGALTQTPSATAHRRIGIATTSTTIAVQIDPTVREVGGAGSENAIPALNDSGLAAYTMIDKAATGGAGAENKLVQANGSGLIDITFLTQAIDTTGQFTASGAITAGEAVALTGNKTVGKVTTSSPTPSVSSSSITVITDGAIQVDNIGCAYRPTDNRYAFAYQPVGTSTNRVIVGRPQGEFFVMGAAATIDGGTDIDNAQVLWDSVSGNWVMVYNELSRLRAMAFTSTDLTVGTSGSQTDLSSNEPAVISFASPENGTTNPCIVYYNTVALAVEAVSLSVSGTTITAGTSVTVDGAANGCSVCFNPNTGKFIAVTISSTAVKAYVISISGTSLTVSAGVTVASGTGFTDEVAIASKDGISNDLVILAGAGDNSGTIYEGEISGTTTSWTNSTALSSGDTCDDFRVFWLSELSKFIAHYRDTVNSHLATKQLTVSSGSISLESEYIYSSNSSATSPPPLRSPTRDGAILSNGDRYRILFLNYRDGVNGWYYYQLNAGEVTTNASGFIGFSEATVADAATVEVSLTTDVNTNQTGLTFGTTYYLLDDGTISTSDTDGNGAVGYALSATKLLNTKDFA
jgi:hypothetical protein